MFIPVPPKISFPIMTPNAIPNAACHNGMVGGSVNGNKKPVTRKPSFTSWFQTIANATSMNPPTANEKSQMGTKKSAPYNRLAITDVGS